MRSESQPARADAPQTEGRDQGKWGFDDLVGQDPAVELLSQAIARDRIAPAYLFVGPSGVGKRLAADRFAEQLLSRRNGYRAQKADPTAPDRQQSDDSATSSSAPDLARLRQRIRQRNHPDLFWVEPTYLHQGRRVSASEAAELGVKRRSPPQIRLEQIREITQFLSRPPLESERAVVVLDKAHTMAEPAANALLKTLEEPGKATLIVLAPGIDALLPTLVSRCQRIPFTRLAAEQMTMVLSRIAEPGILERPDILAIAQGSPGEAIASWKRLQSLDPDLLHTATQPISTLREALTLARQIAKTLDTEEQLWLIDYLQHHYWHQQENPAVLAPLEMARKHLLRYVQPRLVWETTLIAILGVERGQNGDPF